MVTEFASRPQAWRLLSILFRATPVKNVWPPRSQSAGTQVYAVLFYARTAKFMRAQICVGDTRVSFLQAKRRQHHLCQNNGPAIAGSARPAPPALSERNNGKRNSTIKFIQVQIHKKSGAAQAAPAALLLTAMRLHINHSDVLSLSKKKFRRNGTFALFARQNGIRRNGLNSLN